MKIAPPGIEKTVQTLALLAADMRKGKCFPITRLAAVKGLCHDPDAAARFALHVAQSTQAKMAGQRRPVNVRLSHWQFYRRMVAEAVPAIYQFVKRKSRARETYLRELLVRTRETQNDYERHQWRVVRIINSWELLVVETAMECVLYPWASSDVGYRLARQYAEHYDPHFGMGLVPDSAPMMEEIADFWGQYYLGRGWRIGLGL